MLPPGLSDIGPPVRGRAAHDRPGQFAHAGHMIARRRGWMSAALAAALGVGVLVGAVPVAAAAPAPPGGHVDRVTALPGGRLAVSGWALDPSAPSRSITVVVYVDGRKVKAGTANLA